MDQRTRERLPHPARPDRRAGTSSARPPPAPRRRPGRHARQTVFTTAGQTLRRTIATHAGVASVWAETPTAARAEPDPRGTPSLLGLGHGGSPADTGIRFEELTELTHHSLIQYRLPGTGELIPLLHIVPSKTDAERLLVVSPELADVLSRDHLPDPRPRRRGAAGGHLRLHERI